LANYGEINRRDGSATKFFRLQCPGPRLSKLRPYHEQNWQNDRRAKLAEPVAPTLAIGQACASTVSRRC
jgi:hypothetical protein